MNIDSVVNSIHSASVAKLEDDKNRFLELYQRAEPDVKKFIEKFLEWGTHKERSQWRWEMFRTAFNLESCEMLGNFYGFVANCLLDDSYFEIKWVKTCYDENWGLIWLPNGDFKTVETTKDDPKGTPRVFHTSEGFHNPLLLIEAMVIKEEREIKRHKEFDEEDW